MSSRRRFLRRAVAAGGASFAFPAVVAGQGIVALRWQSAWPEKHPFHGHALDFATKVNDMAGGDLRIEVTPLGTVVPAFGLLDAVSSGKLDGAHGALVYQFARHPAFGLWGSGPAYGMDANMLLAWHKYGGGAALLAKLYAAVGADVVSFLYGPRPTQPLGWFKRRITRPQDFRQLRLRTDGLAIDLFRRMGARVDPLPEAEAVGAMQAGLLDGAELDGAASDRALGIASVAKICMLRSFHQSAEQFEILANKPKFDALPAQLKAIIANAAEAASADLSWKAIERDSAAYLELRTKEEVAFHATPDAVLQRQLAAYDAAAAARKGDRLFTEIEKSQRAFAERAVRWHVDTEVDRRMAYRHYFGRRPVAKR